MRHLREWRASQLFSLRALAEAAAITPRTLTDIEYGRRKPTYLTMRRISQALGVAPAEIIEFVAAMEARGACPSPGQTLPIAAQHSLALE